VQHTLQQTLQHTLQHAVIHTATNTATHCNTLTLRNVYLRVVHSDFGRKDEVLHTLHHTEKRNVTNCNTNCNAHCSTHCKTHCNTPIFQNVYLRVAHVDFGGEDEVQHTATQTATHTAAHTAAHCNALYHTVSHRITHYSTHCNAHCNTRTFQNVYLRITHTDFGGEDEVVALVDQDSTSLSVLYSVAVCCSVLQRVPFQSYIHRLWRRGRSCRPGRLRFDLHFSVI